MLSEQLKSFIQPIIDFCSLQFPKECSCCKKEYSDFKDFLRQTIPIGSVTGEMSKVSALEDSFGILSWVNCECGSTITISCADSQKEMHQMFKDAVIIEAEEQKTTPDTILNEMRQEIRKKLVS